MSAGRHTPTSDSTFPAVFAGTAAASVALHALLIAIFPASDPDPLDPERTLGSAQGKKAKADAAVASGDPTCEADVMLAGLARATYCATPFAPEDCLGQTRHSFEDGMLMCNALVPLTEQEIENQAEIALLDPEELELLEPEALMPLPQEQAAMPEPPKPEVEEQQKQEIQKQRPRPRPDGQIVEVTPPDQEEEPEDARYLSEYSNRVEKQTVARGSTEEMVEKPAPKELEVTETPPEQSPDAPEPPDPERMPGEKPDAPDGTGSLAMREPGPVEPHETPQEELRKGDVKGSQVAATEDGIASRKGDGAITREHRDPDVSEQGEGGGGGGQPPVPDLRPTHEMLERAVGGGSVDHLDDAESGETTGLNTKRWKYASFFNRVKRMVAQNWEPWKVYARRDPRGQVYGHKTKITTVKVSLTPEGKVSKIFVVRGSGVDFLDEEAVRAFRAAGPFPNPPMALVDADSKLITFQFSFHVEIGASSSWKIFRSR